MIGKKRKVLLFLVVIIGLSIAILFRLDYRKVELQYVADVKIDPPLTYYVGDTVSWFAIKDNILKEHLEEDLFPQTKEFDGLTWKGIPYPLAKKYTLKWEDGFNIENETFYNVGLGCDIEKITYFYHTKILYRYFRPYSVSLKPLDDRSIIKLYKVDVFVAGL